MAKVAGAFLAKVAAAVAPLLGDLDEGAFVSVEVFEVRVAVLSEGSGVLLQSIFIGTKPLLDPRVAVEDFAIEGGGAPLLDSLEEPALLRVEALELFEVRVAVGAFERVACN